MEGPFSWLESCQEGSKAGWGCLSKSWPPKLLRSFPILEKNRCQSLRILLLQAPFGAIMPPMAKKYLLVKAKVGNPKKERALRFWAPERPLLQVKAPLDPGPQTAVQTAVLLVSPSFGKEFWFSLGRLLPLDSCQAEVPGGDQGLHAGYVASLIASCTLRAAAGVHRQDPVGLAARGGLRALLSARFPGDQQDPYPRPVWLLCAFHCPQGLPSFGLPRGRPHPGASQCLSL